MFNCCLPNFTGLFERNYAKAALEKTCLITEPLDIEKAEQGISRKSLFVLCGRHNLSSSCHNFCAQYSLDCIYPPAVLTQRTTDAWRNTEKCAFLFYDLPYCLPCLTLFPCSFDKENNMRLYDAVPLQF